MSEDLLEQWADLPTLEARAHLRALLQEGPADLELLRAALRFPTLAEEAADLLGNVPAQVAWDLLEQAGREGQPALRKAARRAQHRLRSRGFTPAVRTREAVPPHVERAQASFFDHQGHQLLRLVQTAPLGMLRLAEFVVSPQGLEDCAHVLAGRAEVEGTLGRLDVAAAGSSGFLLEMGLPYVARRVHQGVERSREQGKRTPSDFLEAAPMLEGVAQDAWPAELEPLTEAPQSVSPEEVERLIIHPSMRAWAFPPERLQPYVQEWQEVLQRTPARTEEGVRNLAAIQARGQLTARVITDLCDEATCRCLQEQLPEQARLLCAAGEQQLAGVALCCAAGLEPPPPADHPFLRALVALSMTIAIRVSMEDEEERSPWTRVESGSLWLPRSVIEPRGEPSDREEEKPAPRLWLPGQDP